jgi:hypothetical protein
MTGILLCAALLLSIVMAYIPTTFRYVMATDEQGNQVEWKGLDAICYTKKLRAELEGEVTTQKILEAVEMCQKALKEYDAETVYQLPEDVYFEQYYPYAPFLHGVTEAFADPDTGIGADIREIDLEEVEEYYEKCPERLETLLKMEQRNYPDAQMQAENMYQKVNFPFVYYSGMNGESMDYQTLLIFMITIFCAMIAAPVFSADYQTGADDILRCTRHGKLRLAVTKIVSALLICSVSFLICVTVWILTTNALFGWESTKTSLQMMYSISSLPAMTMGQLEWFQMFASLLCLLSIVSFTLFLSARMRNAVPSLALAILACLFPVIAYVAISGTVGDWLCCLLPGGGIGIQNSLLYALTDLNFLHIGSHSIWNVYVILLAAVVEIPLFIGLAVVSYCRRRL